MLQTVIPERLPISIDSAALAALPLWIRELALFDSVLRDD